MKAIRVREFGAPAVLKIENIPDPTPGPGQVVIAVKAAGVNPVDTYIRAGTYARKPPLPYTPGSDAGGVIESVAADVTRFKPGDRVYISGTLTGSYAEKALSEASRVHPLPERTSFTQAAGIYVPYATAYQSLIHIAKGTAGDTVLVHGASGGVGSASVQIARSRGMTVIGTAGSERGRTLVREQGAHHVLDHHAADFVDQLEIVGVPVEAHQHGRTVARDVEADGVARRRAGRRRIAREETRRSLARGERAGEHAGDEREGEAKGHEGTPISRKGRESNGSSNDTPAGRFSQ